MAAAMEFQKALLSMKCCLCKNVLSVPPIISLSEDGQKLKCGRCENINIPSKSRNFAYENIVKSQSFSCIFKECNQMIPWGEVKIHEDSCDKKTISCPMFSQNNCQKIVQVKKLRQHVKLDHSMACICYDNSTLEMKPNTSLIQLLLSHDEQFLVMIYNSSVPRIFVGSLNDANNLFTYDLKLSSNGRHLYSILVENQPISKYNERVHCLKNIFNKCSVTYHNHSRAIVNSPLSWSNTIDSNLIKPFFGATHNINYNIVIRPKKNMAKQLLNDNSSLIDLLRNQLSCPVCMQFMMSYIYNCEKGHAVCHKCRRQLQNCPTCRANLRDSRNFPLENLADEALLACVNSKNGCNFSGKVKVLFHHENECKFGTPACNRTKRK